MSGFLARWARRKAEAAIAPPIAPAPITPVDAASLPPLDSLTGDSDITAFLAAGVSQALQSQALKIAWQGDAAIASFRGLADYDWDFNAAGYGRMGAADDVAALLRHVVGAPEHAPPPAPAVTTDDDDSAEAVAIAAATGSSVRVSALPTPETVADATMAEPPYPDPAAEAGPPPRPAGRRHGGALPA